MNMKFIKKIIQKTFKFKWYILVVIILVGGATFYFIMKSDAGATSSFYVVDTARRGEVTSGIQTTGDIIAEQKLDIDVYKQLSRIDVVNVSNGSHVEAGKVLVSFDKSDVYVNTQSSRVAVLEAELALENEQKNVGDPNTQMRTLENQIAGYKKSIKDAYLDFLNENIEIKPVNSSTINKTRPTISGRYVKDKGGYRIQIDSPEYNDRHRIESLLIYKVFDGTGMISEHELIYNIATPIADTGLKILFTSAMNPEESDKWEILIPNTEIATYIETKANYEKTVQDLEVSLANGEQDLKDLKQTDGSAYRDLSVEKAQASLGEARQRLSENYDIVQERDIVAPFSGTVEGMENVVVGATPTGGAEDSINLGTLISDEFLTTFSLGATDVAKVKVGQKVKVTVTSFSQQPVFEATITQISSLPGSEGVAQYEVQALLDYDRTTAELVLREGMLADIEVVEQEKSDALRVPTSAIKYDQGIPKVTVIDNLTEEQQQQASRMGIVRTEGVTVSTYNVEVQLGIVGQYYVEIINGVSEGDIIVTSSLTDSGSDSEEAQTGFGGRPPGGMPTGGGQGGGQIRPNSGRVAPTN
jgi:multidrug efflux pump subunit AcrA (membrane-fusion protein)